MDVGATGNSPWVSCAPAMTVGKIGCSLKVVGSDWLWLIGGRGKTIAGADIAGASDIFIGKLQADGTIATWNRVAGALPVSVMDAGVEVKDDWIYVVGGTVPGVSFNYASQTGNFTVGQVVTGLTSGAVGTIKADSDGGTTGTLTLTNITGVFVNDETVTDPLGGAALVNGTLGSVKLDYDGQVKNFTVADVIFGQTSGFTGTVGADADGGASGTLTLTGTSGLVTNNEKLVLNQADVNGTLSTNFFLDYDTQLGNFTVGQVVTAANGAFGTIAADVDGGATGTLQLTAITGTFVAGDVITDPITGSAKVAAAANSTQYKTLSYDAQTKNFVIGDIVWGGTSGATATILVDTDGGATGVLKLRAITGAFADNEKVRVAYADANLSQYRDLLYDAESGNFTLGDTLTDLTSGATGILFSQTDSGATGSVVLRTISGTFANGHVVTASPHGGSATINSVPAINAGTSTAIYRARIDSAGAGVGPFTAVSAILPQTSTVVNSLAFGGNSLLYLAADKLYSAKWFPGGELGPFVLSSPGFSRVDECMLGVNDSNLLVVGGYTGSAVSANVYRTEIEPDGTVQRWTQTAPLPLAKKMGACCVLGDDKLLSIGGIDSGSTVLTEVRVARVDASGKIGGQTGSV